MSRHGPPAGVALDTRWTWTRPIRVGAPAGPLDGRALDRPDALGRAPRACWRVPACPDLGAGRACEGGPCWGLAPVLVRRDEPGGPFRAALAGVGDVPRGPWGPSARLARDAASCVSCCVLEVPVNVGELRNMIEGLPDDAPVLMSRWLSDDLTEGEWRPADAALVNALPGGTYTTRPGGPEAERAIVLVPPSRVSVTP